MDQKQLAVTINGIHYEVTPGCSVLEAVRSTGTEIPTLCYLEQINCIGACRMCTVSINGRLAAACTTKVNDGMEIVTASPKLEALRKRILQLICSDHRQDCSRCGRFPYCELHTLCRRYGIDDRVNQFSRAEELQDCGPHLIRDNSKCVLCRRCISTCRAVQGISAIGVVGRGRETRIQNLYSLVKGKSPCVNCGMCIAACPTGALMEKNDTREVGIALAQKKKPTIAVLTPEGALQLSRYFGTSPASAEGKTIAVLHRLGFQAVYDSRWTLRSVAQRHAQLLSQRLEQGGTALLSATCPSVEKLLRRQYPELAAQLIDCGNPLNVSASLCGADFARRCDLSPDAVNVVTISSCTAEKEVRTRPSRKETTIAALTAHELFRMFERACVSSYSAIKVWDQLPREAFDCGSDEPVPAVGNCITLPALSALGIKAELVLQQQEDSFGSLTEWRFVWQGEEHRAVQVSGLKRLKNLLADPDALSRYAYIEAMACPGGCNYGAGGYRKGQMLPQNREPIPVSPPNTSHEKNFA